MKEYQFKVGSVWLDVMADTPEEAVKLVNEALDKIDGEGFDPPPNNSLKRLTVDIARQLTANDIYQTWGDVGGMVDNPTHPERVAASPMPAEQALLEAIKAIESGKKAKDSLGVYYEQEFGQAFLDHLKSALPPSTPNETPNPQTTPSA